MQPGSSSLSCLAVVAAVLVSGCGGTKDPAQPLPPPPVDAPEPAAAVTPRPAPAPVEPLPPDTVVSDRDVRVGLKVGAGVTQVGGGSALLVRSPTGAELARLPAGDRWELSDQRGALVLKAIGGTELVRAEMLVIQPQVPGQFVRLGDREYRGEVWAFPDRTGVTLVNRLGLESYLAGVVPLEIGSRTLDEVHAVMAQAIVSRTFAVRNMGRWKTEGFDFYATVADQVYGGVNAETDLAWQGVVETHGQILTYKRNPIHAFFFSTCGGRTADGAEVFQNGAQPYLRSQRDWNSSGQPYCRISPRFRWQEEWSGQRLVELFRTTLPAEAGVAAAQVTGVVSLEVMRRTVSERVADLAIELPSRSVSVSGPAVRRTLRRPNGEILRSLAFSLTGTRTGGQVKRLVADGHGAGHGVGMCQWGAIGRARAGERYDQILTAYFPGTSLEQL